MRAMKDRELAIHTHTQREREREPTDANPHTHNSEGRRVGEGWAGWGEVVHCNVRAERIIDN